MCVRVCKGSLLVCVYRLYRRRVNKTRTETFKDGRTVSFLSFFCFMDDSSTAATSAARVDKDGWNMIVFTWLYRLDSLPTFPSSFLYIVVVHFFFLDEKQHQHQQLSQSSSNDDDRIRLQEVYSHWRLHHHVSTRRRRRLSDCAVAGIWRNATLSNFTTNANAFTDSFFSFFSLYLIECVRRKTKKITSGTTRQEN